MSNKKIWDLPRTNTITGNEVVLLTTQSDNPTADLNKISSWFSGKTTAYNFGALDYEPVVSPFDGGPIPLGAQYYNTVNNELRAYGTFGWFTPNIDAQLLAQPTGATMVGTPEGTLQVALNGRVLGIDLSANNGSALVGFQQSGTGATTRTSLEKLRDIVSVLDFGGTWNGISDVSTVAQAALNSGARVIDFLNLPGLVVTSLTVPAGVEARNINLIAGTVGMDVIRPNSGAIISGKITGTGAGGATIERGVHPATDGVNDVYLDLEISNLTVGVQIWNVGLTNIPKRWSGSLRFSGLTGGGAASNGYGLLIAGADDCNFQVASVNTPRHCVYISNGSKSNKVVLQSTGSGGAPLQLAAFSTQDYVENNSIEAFVSGMLATSTSEAYASNVVGKCRYNDITVHVDNSAIAKGGLLLRANDANTVPYRNTATIFHKGGYAGPGVVRSDSGFENRVSVFGEGVASAGAGTAVISVGVYSGITPNGNYDCALRIEGYTWDALGAGMRGVAALAAYAPVDIGQGLMRGHRNSTFPMVYLSGGGTVIGYTHKDTFKSASTPIAGGATLDFSRTYSKPFDNASFSSVKVIAPSATSATMPSYVTTADGLTSTSVRVKNGDPSNSQNFIVVFDTEGY